VKARYGSWMMTAFKLLARCKGLRGGVFDLFGRTAERRMERALIVQYREMVMELLPALTADNLAEAIALAQLPEQVRGFGHVKEQAVQAMQVRQAQLLAAFAQAGTKPAPGATPAAA
jgi:indolepyruvate ferredoxin oxidoreductase